VISLLKDTIAAIATSRGKAALAIIRISGPDTILIVKKISRLKKKTGRK